MKLSVMMKKGRGNAHIGLVDLQSVGLYFFDEEQKGKDHHYLGGVVLSSEGRIARSAYLATHEYLLGGAK